MNDLARAGLCDNNCFQADFVDQSLMQKQRSSLGYYQNVRIDSFMLYVILYLNLTLKVMHKHK